MERRKIIIYAIFVVVVIYGIYFHFLSGETTKKAPDAVRSGETVKASISAPVEDGFVEQDINTGRDKIPEIPNKPGRNPFKKSNSGSP